VPTDEVSDCQNVCTVREKSPGLLDSEAKSATIIRNVGTYKTDVA
jgi:hypothetical protein